MDPVQGKGYGYMCNGYHAEVRKDTTPTEVDIKDILTAEYLEKKLAKVQGHESFDDFASPSHVPVHCFYGQSTSGYGMVFRGLQIACLAAPAPW